MKIKICGITRTEDALFSEEIGAWAVGFIFVKDTPRFLNPDIAGNIIDKLSKRIEKFGVFVNSSHKEISETVKISGLTKIQLHGEESPEFCRKITELTGKEVVKAFRIKEEKDLSGIETYRDVVSYILLDTYSENQYGGTGKCFDWEIAHKAHKFKIPIILAGGLTPDNAKEAYIKVNPFAIDISSGVEKSKGIKDPAKINLLKRLF